MGFLLMSTAPLGCSHAVAPLCFILLFPATVILHLRLLFLFFLLLFYYHYVRKLKAACDNSGESPVSFNPVEDNDGGVQGRSSSSIQRRDSKPDLITMLPCFSLHVANCQSHFSFSPSFCLLSKYLSALLARNPMKHRDEKWEEKCRNTQP